MGGWIALKLALDHPELIDRVVVYDSAGTRFELKEPKKLFEPQTTDDVQRLFSTMEPNEKPLPMFLRRDLLRAIQGYQWTIDRNLSSMTENDLLESRLPSLTEPLLIVWGSDDHLIPLAVGEQIHQLVPRSELDILAGCGHLAPNRCSSRAASATADFLRANPVPSGSVRTLQSMH
jgi:pimeloyl-ACP methyl ester carboxylesterase